MIHQRQVRKYMDSNGYHNRCNVHGELQTKFCAQCYYEHVQKVSKTQEKLKEYFPDVWFSDDIGLYLSGFNERTLNHREHTMFVFFVGLHYHPHIARDDGFVMYGISPVMTLEEFTDEYTSPQKRYHDKKD